MELEVWDSLMSAGVDVTLGGEYHCWIFALQGLLERYSCVLTAHMNTALRGKGKVSRQVCNA